MWKEANLLQVLGVDEAGIQWSILNTQRGGNQKEKQEWFFVAFILSSRIVFRYNLEYLYMYITEIRLLIYMINLRYSKSWYYKEDYTKVLGIKLHITLLFKEEGKWQRLFLSWAIWVWRRRAPNKIMQK